MVISKVRCAFYLGESNKKESCASFGHEPSMRSQARSVVANTQKQFPVGRSFNQRKKSNMIFDLVYVAIGVFLGWFFLPTPTWAEGLLIKLVAKVPFLGSFVKK